MKISELITCLKLMDQDVNVLPPKLIKTEEHIEEGNESEFNLQFLRDFLSNNEIKNFNIADNLNGSITFTFHYLYNKEDIYRIMTVMEIIRQQYIPMVGVIIVQWIL